MVDPDIFNDVPIFSLLDADERRVLAQQVSARNFTAGQTIFTAGDPGTYAYLVQQGKVNVSITDLADETIIVDVCENGGLLGMSSLLAQAEHLTTARWRLKTPRPSKSTATILPPCCSRSPLPVWT
jgi:CRP-like cAMP-binding protein